MKWWASCQILVDLSNAVLWTVDFEKAMGVRTFKTHESERAFILGSPANPSQRLPMPPKRKTTLNHMMKGWLLKFIALCIVLFLVLKASQTWLFTPSAWLERVEFNPEDALKTVDEDYFYHEHDPNVKTQRCDACRLIAHRFDTTFEAAEAKLPPGRQELDEMEVTDIVNFVCSKRTFGSAVHPFQMKDYHRLAAKGLETWNYWTRIITLKNANPDTSQENDPDDVDWSQRLANHCQFFAEKLQGLDIYDMWLRTSAGSREGFETFLCYGEAVFGECLEWIPAHEKWPAGDEPISPEDDEEGTNDRSLDEFPHLEEIAMIWEKPTNSAPSFHS